jgi:hypothetical protein
MAALGVVPWHPDMQVFAVVLPEWPVWPVLFAWASNEKKNAAITPATPRESF